MWVLYPGQIGFWSVGFCRGRKTREKLSEQGVNQLQTQPTCGSGLEYWTWATLVGVKPSHYCAIFVPPTSPSLGHIGGCQALSLLCHFCSSYLTEPGPHWWESSRLTTAPSLFLLPHRTWVTLMGVKPSHYHAICGPPASPCWTVQFISHI